MLIAYAILNAWLIYVHEPWRDEAQVWLLCRDLTIPELFGVMCYEGHSCLWHLLQYPFAHMGASIYIQNIIGLLLVTAAVWILLIRTRLSLAFKAVLLFTPFLTYHFPVIARCYSMAPLILVLLALFYEDRKERPFRYACMIALLVQVHVVMIVTAFCLSVGLLIEDICDYRKARSNGNANAFSTMIRRFIALLLPLGSALLLALQLFNVEKSSLLHIKTASLLRTIEKILEKIQDIMVVMVGFGGRKSLVLFFGVILVVIAFILYRMRKEGIVLVATILCTLAFQFWLYAMAYGSSIQRVLLFILVLLVGMTIAMRYHDANTKGRTLGIVTESAVSLFLILMTVHMVPDIQYDVTGPYSGGIEAAAYIDANIPQDALIVTDNEAEVSAILPFSKTRDHFYYIPAEQDFSFVLWDENWSKDCSYEDFKNRLSQIDQSDRPIYMISSTKMSYIDNSDRLLQEFPVVFHSSAASVKGEDYNIYRVD